MRSETAESEQTAVFLKNSIPLATCFGAAFLDILPIPSGSPQVVAPSIVLCTAFFWCLHRPDLLGNASCFGLGVLIDAIGGTPIGATALVLLALRTALLTPKRYLLAKSFVIIWIYFAFMAAIAECLKWIFACFWYERLLPIEPVMVEWLLTLAIYPFVSLVLSSLNNLLPNSDGLVGE